MRYEDDRHERLARRDPEALTDGEWRAVMTYRMDQFEKRLDSVMKAAWTIAFALVSAVLSLVVALASGAFG